MQPTKAMPVRSRPNVKVLTSQRQRLIDHLKAGQSIHFLQAMQMDIPFLNDRIKELQRQGHTIQAKPIRIGRITCTEYSLQQPSIEVRVLPADEYSQNRFQVNDEWIIECVPTVFGSTRVCLRRKDDITLTCNWCAGNRETDVEYLINVILGYLETGDVDLMPMCSRVKPYYQDEAFKAMIKPYHQLYVSFIVQSGISHAATYTASNHSTPSFTLQS